MLTINPTDPSLVAWPGLDTLIRHVVLRRPEEASAAPNAFGVVSPGAPPLEGPDLSWYRIASRDVGAEVEAIRNKAILAARQAPSAAAHLRRARKSIVLDGNTRGDGTFPHRGG